MSKFKLNFEGAPIAVLSNYITDTEIQYYRDLGFQTVEQLYGSLITLTDLETVHEKALKACKQNLTQEKMDSLAPNKENYYTGLIIDEK